MTEYGGNDEESDVPQFTECGFCGASPEGEDFDGFDIESAFAKSSGKAKAKVSAAAKNLGAAKSTITLQTCNRCKSVAYCSRECQRKDYGNHKGACRKIGELRSLNAQANAKVSGRSAAREVNNNDNQADNDSRHKKVEHPPIKGIPAPCSHPRTSAMSPIDPAVIDEDIVLHCDSPSSTIFDFTGVYSPRLDGGPYTVFVHQPRKTSELVSEIAARGFGWEVLRSRGHFHFRPPDNFYVPGHRSMLVQSPNGPWMLTTQTGERFIEPQAPRSRDKMFWDDPLSVLCMSFCDIYSWWYEHDGGPTPRSRAIVAMTSLRTLKKAADRANFSPTSHPKYSMPADFFFWNRDFVLHIDPRTCQLPLPWIDSLAGIYSPNEWDMNGYPIWARQPRDTADLINAMPEPVKSRLENQGIRIGLPTINESAP
ncbi:hypothetical protein ACHAWF_015127 [Thalassiosira exigua]